MARVRFACVALLVAVLSTRAWAADGDGATDEPPRVGLSLAVGAAVAIVPLAAGGATFAARDEIDSRRAGIYTALTGLTLAPLASHLIGREYRRAAYFTIAPLVGSAVTIGLLESHPELLDHGHPAMRVAFGIGISVAILGAVVGIADSAGAADRWRRRHRPAFDSLAATRDGGGRSPFIAPPGEGEGRRGF
jgi:hypothetical protein